MKVHLVVPENEANSIRGIGSYTRNLADALQSNYSNDEISPVILNSDTSADLVHYTFFDPFFSTLELSKAPTVITIHDLIPLKYPSHFPSGMRGKLNWVLQRSRARRASHIITDSEASKKDIMQIIGINGDRITVIPLAAALGKYDATRLSKVKSKYSLPKRYLLYVGDINWNKNVPGLIREFGRLEDPNLNLVLVGKAFMGTDPIPERLAIDKAVKESGKESLIHRLGFVDSTDLPIIYHEALLYIQPSFDEGFGFPLIEAMSVGCPVLSSNAGSLPEVGGDAVEYFDPYSRFAKDINSIINSPTTLTRLGKLGLKRADMFTWDKVAISTHQVYEKILAK